MNDTIPKYDVALSYADADREYVRSVAIRLRDLGIKVFFDEFECLRLWGSNLMEELQVVYEKEARFAVMFISAAYKTSKWTKVERRFAFSRALESDTAYILPVRFDDTEIEGLDTTLASLAANDFDPHSLANFIEAKVRGSGTVRGTSLLPGSDTRTTSFGTAWRISTFPAAGLQSGSSHFDGKWHKRGMDVLFLAPSLTLAILEAFPKDTIGASVAPGKLNAIRVVFPPAIETSRIELSVLPPEWNTGWGPPWLKDLGEGWARRGETCLLQLPAPQAERECIYMVNMRHPSFSRLTVSEVHPFNLSDL